MPDPPTWLGAQRMEQWAGEVRLNLIRLVAIAAFYANHLYGVYVREDVTPRFHHAITSIAIAWAIGALAMHFALERRGSLRRVGVLGVLLDAAMTTTMLLVTDGPKSTLLPVYLLLIASSVLRQDLAIVWLSTLSSVGGYAVLCGYAKWYPSASALRVPRTQQAVFVIALGVAGLLAGQAVRQTRRIAMDYAGRGAPDKTGAQS